MCRQICPMALFTAMAALCIGCDGGTPIPQEPVLLDEYELHYTESGCFAVLVDDAVGSQRDTIPFQCGRLNVRFVSKLLREDVAKFAAQLGGELKKTGPQLGDSVIHAIIAVEVMAEKKAIEEARADSRVDSANLDFLIIGTIS